MKRKGTQKVHIDYTGDVRRDLSANQLELIGAIAIAYNEAEIFLDIMIAIALRLPAPVTAEFSSRVNGVEGKILILKQCVECLCGIDGFSEALDQTLGKSGFNGLRTYRNTIIHARLINKHNSIGVTNPVKGAFTEVLLNKTALEGVYNRLIAMATELQYCCRYVRRARELVDFLDQQNTLRAVSRRKPDQLAQIDRACAQTQIEGVSDLKELLAQVRECQRQRISLPPLPEFPTGLGETPTAGARPGAPEPPPPSSSENHA